MFHAKNIIDNIKNLYVTDNTLETLMDFERVLDELDIFVFPHWLSGELVEGPIYEKYFITCTFMWPMKLMPDPRGAKRLLDYKCNIKYIKSFLEYPVKIKTPDDYREGTHMPKMAKKPVWLVKITMPKTLMKDIQRGSVSLETHIIDLKDIQQSYEIGLDDDVHKEEQKSSQNRPTQSSMA